MQNITAPLQAHHKTCDEVFAQLEETVSAADWDGANRLMAEFSGALLGHFKVEEDSLFPAFEQSTGMAGGPTRVMRMEHMQMRSLLADLGSALVTRNADEFLGSSETLLVLMQQHNMKEENILYPMCDDALSSAPDDLGRAISAGLEEVPA